MIKSFNEDIIKSIQDFKLPKYEEIPNVGLYLEQTAKYISEYLAPLQDGAITGSMISNYVKKGLVSNPVKSSITESRLLISFLLRLRRMCFRWRISGCYLKFRKKPMMHRRLTAILRGSLEM